MGKVILLSGIVFHIANVMALCKIAKLGDIKAKMLLEQTPLF